MVNQAQGSATILRLPRTRQEYLTEYEQTIVTVDSKATQRSYRTIAMDFFDLNDADPPPRSASFDGNNHEVGR